MIAYFRSFVHYKQNICARLLLITKFAYNNVKNMNSGHILFKLNCSYYPCIFYKKDINLCFKLKSVDKL